MKWINHKITTFSIVYLFTQDVVISIISAAGSIIPDAVEWHDYNSESWRRRHRKMSHWLFGYFILACILGLLMYFKAGVDITSLRLTNFKEVINLLIHHFNSEVAIFLGIFVAFYLTIGAILHIIEDSLSSTVPIFNPQKRVFTLRLIPTGSFLEYFLSFALLAMTYIVTGGIKIK